MVAFSAQRQAAEMAARQGSGAAATQPRHWSLPVLLGAVIGTLVTFTSVGAGAIGVTVLLLVFPHLPLPRIIAADIAYAVPLTLVAGLGPRLAGLVDWACCSCWPVHCRVSGWAHAWSPARRSG